MLNMVFDFNAWNKKWVACKTGTPMKKYYWEKLKEAQEDFKDDWRMFLEAYNDPTHKMRINYDFLTEKLDEILERDVYIPSDFRCHLYDMYPQREKELHKNGANQIGSERNSSVLACGLKPLMANTIYEEDEKRLLLFEVWEFTLTYPEYEDLFIEEIIE